MTFRIAACGAVATLVLVGVAENIDDLLRSHASVVRNLRQVHLPWMSDDELGEIIDKGLASAGFTIDPRVRQRVVVVSQGFPHFTHLLAQYSARAALDGNRRAIEAGDLAAGMGQAVERSDQSIRETYHKAATGVRKGNRWREVIAACALAESDDRATSRRGRWLSGWGRFWARPCVSRPSLTTSGSC